MATQTIDRVVKTTTIKRATRAYPYKTQENNTTSKKTTNNKIKHTRKVKKVTKNASK